MNYFEMTFHVEANAQYFENDYALTDDWNWQGGWNDLF